MLATCVLAVCSLTTSSLAISAFEWPRATSRSTSCSRAVSSPSAADAGVAGRTNCSITRRVAAVRVVASGEALLAPAITRSVIEEFARHTPPAAPTPPPQLTELTSREREVLDLLVRGLSNPEICERLVVGEATTKTRVARILQKLGLRDRVQAVIWAYESGLLTPGAAEELSR